MKTLITSIFTLIVSIALTNMVYGQASKVKAVAKDTIQVTGTEATSNSDVVINKEMIESFRRCYDKIEVVAWGDMFRSVTNEDAGVTWMAYKNLAFVPSNDSIGTASLASEKEKIRDVLKNTDAQKKSIDKYVPEHDVADKTNNDKSLAYLPSKK